MQHFKIVTENGRKRIYGLEKDFGDIASLLEHYEQRRIDPGLSSIGEACNEVEYNRTVEQEERLQGQQKQCMLQ